jgi:rubredoxin
MEKPARCPECGSTEIRETTRPYALYGDITAFVCGACDWASDPRIGRPPADRSKNVTLRRMIADADETEQPEQ